MELLRKNGHGAHQQQWIRSSASHAKPAKLAAVFVSVCYTGAIFILCNAVIQMLCTTVDLRQLQHLRALPVLNEATAACLLTIADSK